MSAAASLPRIAVLASGGGRSLENLARRIRARELALEIALVVCDRAGAGVLERAREFALPSVVLDPERTLSPAEFSRALFAAVEAARAELIVLAGFLRLLAIPPAWEGRVLNIHPSLLPAFGGKGFYGERVHQAVIARGCQFSGCSVHYVTNEYDAGPILVQRCVRVEAGETPEALAAKVFEEEKIALPDAIRLHFSRARKRA